MRRIPIITRLVIIMLVAYSLMAVAFAQATTGTFNITDFFQWGTDPLLMIGGVAAIVHLLRTSILPSVSGKIAVGALTVVVGAVGGVLVAVFGGVHIAPFDQLHNAIGAGLTYGAVEGLSAFIGVNLVDLWHQRKAAALANAGIGTAVPPASTASGGGSGNPAPAATPPASGAAK